MSGAAKGQTRVASGVLEDDIATAGMLGNAAGENMVMSIKLRIVYKI